MSRVWIYSTSTNRSTTQCSDEVINMHDRLELAKAVPQELITPKTMGLIDQAAIASGIRGIDLMTNAGEAIGNAIIERFAMKPVVVLCGPGNNGGDGYIVAEFLRRLGWPVQVTSLTDPTELRGDAAIAAAQWQGQTNVGGSGQIDQAEIIIDALFGAGLSRSLDGLAAELARASNASVATKVAVDLPSGIEGRNGQPTGPAIRADLSVTFCRLKPGHVLEPGRSHCGEIICADIGIPDEIVGAHDERLRINGPNLWLHELPVLDEQMHKYSRGHVLVVGGPYGATGAATLAARAAHRSGAGLVSVACDPDTVALYAPHFRAEMTKAIHRLSDLERLVDDRRIASLLIGPGAGICPRTRQRLKLLIESGKPLIIDADGLSCLAQERSIQLHDQCVLTPHAGEFKRLFGSDRNKLDSTIFAAQRSGAVIVNKGRDTVVAKPNGSIRININAPPYLATAGSGDVLAGIVAGLLAQGMKPFDAAAAGVFVHAEAAKRHGPGLIASSIENHIFAALNTIA